MGRRHDGLTLAVASSRSFSGLVGFSTTLARVFP